MILTGIPMSLAVFIIKPVFFVPFLIFYGIAMYIIFRNIFHDSGLANALENYERRFDEYKKNWNLSDYLTRPYDLIENAKNSHSANEEYTLKSKRFTFMIFFLVGGLIPLVSMFFGLTMYGIALSGYLSYLAYSFQPIKRMTKGIYHSDKLKLIVDQIHDTEIFKWEKKWDQMRSADLDPEIYGDEWKIEAIELKDATLLSPGDEQKCLLNKQSISFHRNECIILAAQSGAGKTETGKTISFKRPLNSGSIHLKLVNRQNGSIKWVTANPHNFKLTDLKKRISFISFDDETGASLRDLLMMSEGISPEEWKHIVQMRSQLLKIKNQRGLSQEEEKIWNIVSRQYEQLKEAIESSIQEFIDEHTYRPNEPLTDLKSKMLSDLSMEDIRSKLDLNLSNFSSGQQKRIKLALNLKVAAKNADFIILDEPFSSVQGHQKDRIGAYLKKWQKQNNVGLIVIDHHDRKALQAERVISLSHGEIIPYKHFDKQFEINQKLNQLSANPYDILNMDLSDTFLKGILAHLADEKELQALKVTQPRMDITSIFSTETYDENYNQSLPLDGVRINNHDNTIFLNENDESPSSSPDSQINQFNLEIYQKVNKAHISSLRLKMLVDLGYFKYQPVLNMQELLECLELPDEKWALDETPTMVSVKKYFVKQFKPKTYMWARFLAPDLEFDISSIHPMPSGEDFNDIENSKKREKTDSKIIPMSHKPSVQKGRRSVMASAILVASTPFLHSCNLPMPVKDDNTITTDSSNVKQPSMLNTWNNARQRDDNSRLNFERNAGSQPGKIMGSMEVMGEMIVLRGLKNGSLNFKIGNGSNVKKDTMLLRYSPNSGVGRGQIAEATNVMLQEENLFKQNMQRVGIDISQGELLAQEIKTNMAKVSVQTIKQKSAAISVKAPYDDGVFYHRLPFDSEASSISMGEIFDEGDVLGYLVYPRSQKKNVKIKFQTDNIFRCVKKYKDKEDGYYIEINVDGKHISVPFNAKAVKSTPYNLEFEINTELDDLGIESGMAYQVTIVENENTKTSTEPGHSENIFLKQPGTLYYPETLNYHPVTGGIISGVNSQMLSGYFPAKNLAQLKLKSPESYPQLKTLDAIKSMYEKRIENLKKLTPHGEGNAALNDAIGRLADINRQRNSIHYHSGDKKINTKEFEGWMVTEFNLRNLEYFPSIPLMSNGKPYLRIVNSHKIFVDINVGMEMADEMVKGIKDGTMKLQVEIQKRRLDAVIVSQTINVPEGIAIITIEIDKGVDRDVLQNLNIENLPSEVLVTKLDRLTKEGYENESFLQKDGQIEAPSLTSPEIGTPVNKKFRKDRSQSPLGGLIVPILIGGIKTGKNKNSFPDDILGVYLSFQVLNKFHDNSPLVEVWADYVIHLLRQGYPLKNRQHFTDLKILKEKFQKGNISQVYRELEKILPKKYASALIKKLVHESVLYNPITFFEVNKWFVPVEALWEEVDSDIKYLKIVNEWLPVVLKKMSTMSDSNLQSSFLIESILVDQIVIWLADKIDSSTGTEIDQNMLEKIWLDALKLKAEVFLKFQGITSDDFNPENIMYREAMLRFWRQLNNVTLIDKENGNYRTRKIMTLIQIDPLLGFFIYKYLKDNFNRNLEISKFQQNVVSGDIYTHLYRSA